MSNITFDLSNSTNYIDESIKIVNEFAGLWKNQSIEIKKDIQNIVFSNHIEYDVKSKTYRTPYENEVLSMMVRVSDKIKTGSKRCKTFKFPSCTQGGNRTHTPESTGF